MIFSPALVLLAGAAAAFDGALMRVDEPFPVNTNYCDRQSSLVDVEGDGLLEVHCVGHYKDSLLELEPGGRTWRERWIRYSEDTAPLDAFNRVRLADVDADGDLEVFAIGQRGAIVVLSLATGDVEAFRQVTLTDGIVDFELADLLPEPGLELAVLGRDVVEVFSSASPTPAWSMATWRHYGLAVGQMDADPALELVAANDESGQVIDAGTRSVEWNVPFPVGQAVKAEDVDGDGLDEIVACAFSFPYSCRSIDADIRSIAWTQDMQLGGWLPPCLDLVGDSAPEVVVAQLSREPVLVLDGVTGSVVAELTPDAMTDGLMLGDVDGDCEPELVWSSTFAHVHAEWPFGGGPVLDGPSPAETSWRFACGDIDGDGRTEILTFEDHGTTTIPRRLRISSVNERRLISRNLPDGSSAIDRLGIHLVQADADVQLEYVLGDGGIALYDGQSHQRQWASGASLTSVEIADASGDGMLEVIVTHRDGVQSLRALDGRVTASSPPLNSPRESRVGDLGGDGTWEVVTLDAGDDFQVLDGSSLEIRRTVVDNDVEAFALADVDGSAPGDELIVARADGTVTAFAVSTGIAIWATPSDPVPVRGMRAFDLDGDGVIEIVARRDDVSGNDRVEIIDATGAIAWQSPPFMRKGNLPESTFDIVIGDHDDDGFVEVATGTPNQVKLYEYGRIADDRSPVFAGLRSVALAPHAPCCPVVDLAWSPARDDRSPPVTYDVFRGSLPDFDPSPATRVHRTRALAWRDTSRTPGDTAWYVVRSVDASGNSDGNVARVEVAVPPDAPPMPPRHVRIGDVDICAGGIARLSFVHPGFPLAGHYELERDGTLLVPFVESGDTFDPGDALDHDYVVVAVDDTCAHVTRAVPVRHADSADCTGRVGDCSIRLARSAASDAITVTWTPAQGEVMRYDAYVGNLDSLQVAYDHAPAMAGVSFPDAADISRGCGVGDAASTSCRVHGLASGHYILMGAVSTAGTPGPLGIRSDGVDRRHPSVEPRSGSAFCP